MFGGGVMNVKHTRFTSPHTELVPDHIPANISDPGPQLYQDGVDFFCSESDRWWCHVWNVFHKGHNIHQIASLGCWFEAFFLKDCNKTWRQKYKYSHVLYPVTHWCFLQCSTVRNIFVSCADYTIPWYMSGVFYLSYNQIVFYLSNWLSHLFYLLLIKLIKWSFPTSD